MEIKYKRLTEAELETFIDMRINQLTKEYYLAKCSENQKPLSRVIDEIEVLSSLA